MFNIPEPVQPTTKDWAFVDELKTKFNRKPVWYRDIPMHNELDLRKGVKIHKNFPDPEGLLDKAWEDLERFINYAGIPLIVEKNQIGLEHEIITIQAIEEKQGKDESFCIEVNQDGIMVKSGDIEGIRRGIFYIEDLLLAAEGPFLAPTTTKRTPWVKNRISRCFFGPIKRPPLNRDELMDEIDYYPDEYLNRLSHEGINILWITAEFRDICKTDMVPEYGLAREKRLNKLRHTIDKCRQYGIKVFIFCIEPKIWGPEDPLLLNNSEVKGATNWNDPCFCPFSETAQKYLYEAVKSIFIEVPKLGGIISITYGERTTSCLSSASATSEREIDCPRCSKKEKGEILEATHIPMLRAMHEVNPDAQFISWMYMPLPLSTAQWKYTIPAKLPKDTVLLFNFESDGEKEQLGKVRIGSDYWQSYIGPSRAYTGMAKASQDAGTGMGAKIQVGCSHEVATIPFVPAPSVLWKKYHAMHSLNVTTVMQSWYFGNYPGIMNKAAGELSFEDLSNNDESKELLQMEEDFLTSLAKIEWGSHAEQVVKGWKYLDEGYGNYPMDVLFQYYGPMHDGVVWPLHLFPVHTPLAPTWKLEFGTSGDSIGECMVSFTIKEAIELCQRMSDHWSEGTKIMKELVPYFAEKKDRLKDIGVVEALDLQFKSGLNILSFYDMRDQILWNTAPDRNEYLDKMEAIVKEEIKHSLRMVELCEFDSRLGFHSEAEGYKYFPAKLHWRVKQLEYLLKEEFPNMRKLGQSFDLSKLSTPSNVPVYNCSDKTQAKAETFEWTAKVQNGVLLIDVKCHDLKNDFKEDQLYLYVKAGALGYPYNFSVTPNTIRNAYIDRYIAFPLDCFYEAKHEDLGWTASFEISLDKMPGYRGESALAISIVRKVKSETEEFQDAWSGDNPQIRERLSIGNYNPEAMGRLELNIV